MLKKLASFKWRKSARNLNKFKGRVLPDSETCPTSESSEAKLRTVGQEIEGPTEEQLQDWTRVFRTFDRDDSGEISFAELSIMVLRNEPFSGRRT